MKLRRIKLANWCQHKDREIMFDNGIIGIVGPNGSGKSNILKAILFALTGYTLGTRIESLTHGTKTGYVELDFFVEEEATTYRVVRNIHNGDVFLYRDNGSVFELISDRPATARDIIAELVPIPPDVAEQIYAVGQEEMVELLRMSSTKRSDIMQRVFSLMFFSKIYKKLRDTLNRVDDDARSLEAQLLLLKDQESAVKTKVTTLTGVPPRDALERLIKEYSKQYEEVASMSGAISLREYIEKEIRTSQEKLDGLRSELSMMYPPGPPTDEDSATIRGLIQDGRNALKEFHSIVNLFNSYYSVQRPEPFDEGTREALRKRVEEARAEWTECQRLVENIKKCGTTGVCPTCGAPVKYTEKDLEDAEARGYEARKAYQKAQSDARANEELRDKVLEASMRLKGFEERIRDLISKYKYSDVSDATYAYFTDMELQTELAIHDWERELHDRIRYEDDKAAYDAKVQSVKNSIATLEVNLNTLRGNPVMAQDFSGMSVEFYNKEKERLSKELESLRQQQIQRVQLDAAQTELQGIQKDISRIQGLFDDTHPALRYTLWQVDELFKSKNFPTRVAFAIYKKLEERLNIYLAEFEAPYKVEMKENGDFDCVFDSGLHQLSARLSGGQKMVLAIAFRIALHSVFATDDTGGFIALDEPTTFLDEKNRDALCSVLNTLKTSPLFRDLQIFVVTHDDMLRPLFNCLVDLEA